MSEFKFGEEVQVNHGNGHWRDARFVCLLDDGKWVTVLIDEDDIRTTRSHNMRRKPRTETMTIQIVRTPSGYYYPCKVGSSVGQFEVNVGEPFEHTFEVSE